MRTPEEFARHLADTEDGTLDPATETWAADLIRARDAEITEQLRAEVARLRAGIEDARTYCSRSTFCVTIPPTGGARP